LEASFEFAFAFASVPTLFYVIRKQRGLELARMAVADWTPAFSLPPTFSLV
jgi:hypothetical protein